MGSEEVLAFLKISNSQQLIQFLHDCVDDLVEKSVENYKNYNNEVEWTKDDYEKAKNLVQNIFKEHVLNESYTYPEALNEQAKKAIETCYLVRKSEVSEAVIKKILLNSKVNMVENIDWKLKWVLGSSALAMLREPLLQVDLKCMDNNCVNFEMNLEQLNKFISELESAKIELGKV